MTTQVRNKVFKAFIQQCKRFTASNKQFRSSKSVIQSSVGMIFQAQPSPQKLQDLFNNNKEEQDIENLNLFFAQRGGYIGDLNAYNIVLPGGQVEIGQTDFEACKRQIYQQIGLKVDQSCLYLGQVPKNFFYRKKGDRGLFMNCHIWIMKKGYENWKPTLNPDQLIDYKWVPFGDFLKIENYSYSNEIMKGIVQRSIPRKLSYFNPFISKQIYHMNIPVLNVKMKKDLWGLTLFLCSYVLQMATYQLKNQNKIKSNQISLKQRKQNVKIIQQTQKIIQRIEDIDISFNRAFILGYPIKLGIKAWHYNNRIIPFSYEKKVNKVKLGIYTVFIMIFLVIVWWMYLSSL